MDERVINLAEKLFVEGFKEQLKKEVTLASTVAGVCLSYAKAFYAEADKRSNVLEPVKDKMTKVRTSVIPCLGDTNFRFEDFMNTNGHKNYISKNKPKADEVTAMTIIDGVTYNYKANQYPHWMNVKYATKSGQVVGCSSKNISFNETLGEYVCMDEDAVFVTLFNEMYEGPVKGSLVYTDLPF